MKYIVVPTAFELEKQLVQMNHEVALSGFYLTKEQIQLLYQTMAIVCQKYQMVETNPSMILHFITTFYDSRYIKAEGLVTTIQAVIDVYYALRSVYPITLSDDDILDRMKLCYLQNHGGMDKKTRYMVMKKIQKEEHYATFDEV